MMKKQTETWRPFMGKMVWLIVMIVFAGPGALNAADLGHARGTQWATCLKWSVANPSWTGSPLDVMATVMFTHQPTCEKRTTEIYYDGATNWAFRFTGTKQGVWTFVCASDDPDLDGHAGKVTIEPNPDASAHGFLKNFNEKWGWQGTENAFVPQLIMWDYLVGNNNPKVFHENPALIDDRIREFLGAHGFSGFHVSVVGGRWFNLDATSDKVESTMTDPDPRTFEALELLIAKVHASGGFVHIWCWGDDQRSQTPRSLAGGIQGPIDLRLQRYIAARLGPMPGWSMGYGFDLDEWVTAAQLKAWRDNMHRHMGWHHFLGGRPAGPNQGTDHTRDAPWNHGLDYSSYEHHRPSYEVYVASLRAVPGQPVLSEDRFRIRRSPYPEKDYSQDRARRGLYHSTMAGGVANIWGIDPELSSGGVFPNKEQIQTYAMFFDKKRRFLADMQPANRLSHDPETRVLQSPSTKSLVLYREDTNSIHVDLTGFPGPQPALAIDTRKPYAEIDLGELQPQDHPIKLATVSDWVVAIGHFR
ncbi:MAG: DUF5060 domain-containing protein [Pirellulales bacterium]|nr:DUF5060 domain-containing protein [Pirellulales bacterium]